jgi:hypothetical protein
MTRLETRIKEFTNSARHDNCSYHVVMRVIGLASPDLALALSEVLLIRPERWRSTLGRLEASWITLDRDSTRLLTCS